MLTIKCKNRIVVKQSVYEPKLPISINKIFCRKISEYRDCVNLLRFINFAGKCNYANIQQIYKENEEIFHIEFTLE